jgi:pyruvate/2-oxoglutarate dehydrogenase complex dihydrolipoamide acyltransferase (E2) component
VLIKTPPSAFEVRPFPRSRRIIVDGGRANAKRHAMVGLVEMDVTEARRLIREHERATGQRISFTAFIVACVAGAVAAEPSVQAYRDLRDRLIVYRDVDVSVSVETRLQGGSFPLSHVIRAANERSVGDIHREIRAVQRDPSSSPSARLAGAAQMFVRLPGFARTGLQRVIHRLPQVQRSIEGTVGVTSVGMFGAGGGWGFPFQIHSLNVVVGGIVERPAYVDGEVVPREFVDLTLSFDHDVVDGAPAARFTAKLRELIESAKGLDQLTTILPHMP